MAKRKSTVLRQSSMRFLRNFSASSRIPTPSSALLAVLAGLVGSVNSFPVACDPDSPLPPFLCPHLEDRAEFNAQEYVLPPQTSPPSAPVPGPSRIAPRAFPTPRVEEFIQRDLAPGYTQGPDGRWRKLYTWSLYGSTVCVCHDATGTQPADDVASTPSTSQSSETDLLPPGWTRMSDDDTARTILILSLSLLLAALIAVFIFLLIWWRRKRKIQQRRDLEEKLVKKRDSKKSLDSQKEHRAKVKLWARATTRWKENVRHSARKRRNARVSNTSLHTPSISDDSVSRGIPSAQSSPRSRISSLPPTRASSPTPTVSTTHSFHSSPSRTDHEPRNFDVEPPSNSPSTPPLPPAYHGTSHLSADIPSGKDPAQLPSASSIRGPQSSPNDSLVSNSPPPSPLESDMTPSNLRTAHVATDDKALLRQMETMGSQPPTEHESSDVLGSAPILYEDDVQPFDHEDSPELVSSPVGFPPPPRAALSSKGKAAALEYYDQDDLNVEPELQPSAPPFEAENSLLPSAPPEDGTQPLPSAPPDPDDDPTTSASACLPQQMGGHSVDTARPGPSRSEPLPQYRP